MQELTSLETVSNVQAALNAGKKLAQHPFEINGTPTLIINADETIQQFEGLRETPIRIKQHSNHTTAESFILYYNDFATERSTIFIDTEKSLFSAVLDYHNSDPAWKEHTLNFKLKPTLEFSNWKESDGLKMDQETFGRFIEDNLYEITEPVGADMLQIALSIQATTETKFASSKRLDNGQLQLNYHEEINGTAGNKGELKIPQTFKIGLRLFEGGEAYEIEARLRYRINSGNLTLWYELIRPQKTIDACTADTEKLIREKTEIGFIYHGTAE